VTVALGLLAGTGIVIAADTEETVGENKVSALKTRTSFWHPFAVTGAGNGSYIDAITQELESCQAKHATDTLSETLSAFYVKHVIPFSDDQLDFQLIIGVQREDEFPFGGNALWVTYKSTMRRVYGSDAVGVGDIQAKSVMDAAPMISSIGQGVLLACCAVYQAKLKTVGCGQGTTVDCLYHNQTHSIFPDVIDSCERWFEKYTRISHSSFAYCLNDQFAGRGADAHLDKIAGWSRDLRTEADKIIATITNDLNKRGNTSADGQAAQL
jgi:hypothetical protein